MDEIDHIQEAASLAQEAILAERRRLAAIEAAIVPPASRECDSCGCDIPAGRLKLAPRTRLCFDCQTDAENPRR